MVIGTITYDSAQDEMSCTCGNLSHNSGFIAVDENFLECEPDHDWAGLYQCQDCGASIRIPGGAGIHGHSPATGGTKFLTPPSSLTDLFGPVIHSYTRAEAIEDGTLIDLGAFSFRPNLTILQEAGIKFPTAITRAAYNRAIQEEGRDLPPCQDLSGRMWDLCYMFALAARRSGGSEIRFRLSVWNWIGNTQRTKHETITLKALCGPGDDAEPVITIMLPDED